jgi:energy-coupling factor transporter ATP-binding protein EcfA2
MDSKAFKIPIEYIHKIDIDNSIKEDLEFNSKNYSLYKSIYGNNNKVSELNINNLSRSFTNNKLFLKETQKLIKSNIIIPPSSDDIIDILNDVSNKKNFLEKYHFIDFEKLKFLNSNEKFLQLFSLYNISSPLISLAMPLFLLMIPFFIIRSQGCEITASKYFEVLKVTLQNHSIGKIFSIGGQSWDKKLYIILTFVFYIFQIYSNIQSCKSFFTNMKKIHSTIFTLREYISNSLININSFLKTSSKLKTYDLFNKDLIYYKNKLEAIKNNCNEISDCKLSFSKINEIGKIMKLFYEINNDDTIITSINYLVYYNGYIENMCVLKEKIDKKQINKCLFSKKTTYFNNIYYPSLIDSDPVKNDINIDNNIILTGPNAAGKTTLLKSILFNIIFSQQTGYGFYDKCKLTPFDKIKCYINIPDTTDRDSLFQAEARRCINILNSIKPDEKTFCVFDEIFSGTNPYEAVASGTAYLNYLNKFKNINFVITTHFINICKYLSKEQNIENYNMKILIDNNDNMKYTYKISKGISYIKGGLSVLKDLNYPDVIIKESNALLKTIEL